jgi:hypothetical protein
MKSVILIPQKPYDEWLLEQERTPSFFDVADFPDGFETFWNEGDNPALFWIKVSVFDILVNMEMNERWNSN